MIGHHFQIASLRIGDLQQRQKFCKIVFHAGDIEFVHDRDIHVLPLARLIHLLQKQRFVEAAGELIVVPEQVGALLPHRLHGNDDGGIIDKFPERIRERRFARTRHTLQDEDAGNGKPRDKLPDIGDIIVQIQAVCGKEAEFIADLMEGARLRKIAAFVHTLRIDLFEQFKTIFVLSRLFLPFKLIELFRLFCLRENAFDRLIKPAFVDHDGDHHEQDEKDDDGNINNDEQRTCQDLQHARRAIRSQYVDNVTHLI